MIAGARMFFNPNNFVSARHPEWNLPGTESAWDYFSRTKQEITDLTSRLRAAVGEEARDLRE